MRKYTWGRFLCLALLAVFTLSLMPAAGSMPQTKQRRYVPFLDKRVRVSVLNQKVKAHDISFKDYGASGRQGARQMFDVDGSGVEICIVDTGVDERHEQLDSNVVAFTDFVNFRTLPYDDQGHGTHVASIAAGDGTGGERAKRYQGVAPGASISAAKVLDRAGSGTFGQVISGIEWCAERGADVISMSLGGPHTDGTDVLSQAVDKAVEMGSTVVVSAGNAGPRNESVGTPGSAAGALTVGASAEWSKPKPGGTGGERSFGPYLGLFSSRGGDTTTPKPDVVAPGVSVVAAEGGGCCPGAYTPKTGTSMSAPYVAGTVALMLEADSTLGPGQVKNIVQGTALDAGPVGHDFDWGYGLVNTYSAVARALGQAERDIFPPHFFFTGAVPVNSSLTTWKLNIGVGVLPPVTTRRIPIAITMLMPYDANQAADVDLDMMLGDDLTRQMWLSSSPYETGLNRRQETLGVKPKTLNHPFGYVLHVFPGIFGKTGTGAGSFSIDVFYR